jgi:hypothetical protein
MKAKVLAVTVLVTLGLLLIWTKGQATSLDDSTSRLPKSGLTTLTAFTLRPTIFSPSIGYSNPALAFDANFSTASSITVSHVGKGATSRTQDWWGFPNAPTGATGMTLNVNSSAATAGGPSSGGAALVYYSLDNGANFTLLFIVQNGQTKVPSTNTLALSNSQNLSLVRVRAEASVYTLGPALQTTQSVYEIWISGNH